MKNVFFIKQPVYKKIIKNFFNFFNLEIKRKNNWFDRYRDSVVELNNNHQKIIKKVENIINASIPNQWGIIQSLIHIKKNKIIGDIVETGVFHGGGLILINEILKNIKLNKKIWGYDTFEGVPDINIKNDEILGDKKILLNKKSQNYYSDVENIYSNIENVKINLKNNGFKKELPKLIKGDTRVTLLNKKNIPKKISFIRLDTDFYESTLKELQTLYPRLSKNGVLLIDDYGHHKGCKKAVDEYFKNKKIWLHRVDYTARLLIKA